VIDDREERGDTMKLNSISGINCYVRDLSRTAEFYETLGFRRGKEEPDRLTFYVNWFFVTFIDESQEEDPDRSGEGKGAGVQVHIKVDDVEEFHSGVVASGLTPASEPRKRRGGGRELILRDPDGYRLVFFEKK
jgi:catechol 2,3-dioxygenase-like lactoylglutathione lyase family enzyme